MTVAICLSFAYPKPNAQAQATARASAPALPATVVYSQPASGILLSHQSSQIGYNPYTSDYDQYVWDAFTLSATRVITEIAWRGFYRTGGYWGGGLVDFTISVYPSAVANTEPDHANPPLVKYTIGGNAGETPAWTPGSAAQSIHDYTFTLPTPFTATAGIKYWVQIEGIQNGPADWGVVTGIGGDGSHFYAIPGAGDFRFGAAPGDAAFTLLGPPSAASGTPLAAVSISGPTVGVINTSYPFSATISPITATTPITYIWSPTPDSGQGAAVVTYTWPTAGDKVITVTAENVSSTVSNTYIVHVQSLLTGVAITGLTAGVVNKVYTFTTTLNPRTVTPAITYTWLPTPKSGQGAASATYAWPTVGRKTITVTAESVNITVSDTHTITLADQSHICLPLILR